MKLSWTASLEDIDVTSLIGLRGDSILDSHSVAHTESTHDWIHKNHCHSEWDVLKNQLVCAYCEHSII